jgi:predicted DNA-binding ribbon-helix-helix protein
MRLGTQVTIRLEPEMADRLREIASRRRCGYTTLLRGFLEERLLREADLLVSKSPDIQVAGVASTFPPIQMSS